MIYEWNNQDAKLGLDEEEYKEGDEGRYTEEALEKAREAADKTFCEPMWVWRKN